VWGTKKEGDYKRFRVIKKTVSATKSLSLHLEQHNTSPLAPNNGLVTTRFPSVHVLVVWPKELQGCMHVCVSSYILMAMFSIMRVFLQCLCWIVWIPYLLTGYMSL
jgi:hypothetical protein